MTFVTAQQLLERTLAALEGPISRRIQVRRCFSRAEILILTFVPFPPVQISEPSTFPRTEFRGGIYCESCDLLFHCHETLHWISHLIRGHNAHPMPVVYVRNRTSPTITLMRSDGLDDDGLESWSGDLEFEA